MLASNGQVAYLGYDPKSDGTGEFLLALFSVLFCSLPFSVSIPFSGVVSSFPVLRSFCFSQALLEVGVVIDAQRAAAAAASDLDSDLSSNWWL